MNLKAYRINKNLKQSDCAKHINVSRETYRRKENKKIPFSLKQAVDLSDLLGITLEEFYEATR